MLKHAFMPVEGEEGDIAPPETPEQRRVWAGMHFARESATFTPEGLRRMSDAFCAALRKAYPGRRFSDVPEDVL